MKKRSKTGLTNNRPQPPPILIDDDERQWRAEALEEAIQKHRADGFELDSRMSALCDQFLHGQIDEHELTKQVMAPYLS